MGQPGIFITSAPSLPFAGSARPLGLLRLLPDWVPYSILRFPKLAHSFGPLSPVQATIPVWSVDKCGVRNLRVWPGLKQPLAGNAQRMKPDSRNRSQCGDLVVGGACGETRRLLQAWHVGKGHVSEDPSCQSMQGQALSHSSAGMQPDARVGSPAGHVR